MKLVNRAKMTITAVASSGTGTLTLGAATSGGFSTFAAAGLVDNDKIRYTIEGPGDIFEIGVGVYTASGTTLARTPTETSNADNSAITATTASIVFATLSAEDLSGNAAPIWTTTPPSNLILNNDNSTAVTLTGVAIDEFPVRYSWDGYSGTTVYTPSSLPPQLASPPTFSAGQASLVGSSTTANAGTFNFRMKATDGVKTATATTLVRLSFAFDLSTASYDSVDFGIVSQDGNAKGMAFNTDGTKMYVVGLGNDKIYQYSLDPGFDLSTARYDNVDFDVSGQDTAPRDMAFNTDGTKMYVVGATTDAVYQYSLDHAFNLRTASYDSVSFSVPQDGDPGYPSGLAFNTYGTKMYMVGYGSDAVYEYNLSTGFDLSTASYNSVSFSITQDSGPAGLAFSSLGEKMYVCGWGYDKIYQYSLSTDFDLSTASYDSVELEIDTEDESPSGIVFSADQRKLYVVGAENDKIYQYSD